MNSLKDEFGDKLAVLGVPSNQFGHQTNENEAQILKCHTYSGKFTLIVNFYSKCTRALTSQKFCAE
jgi:glutathione peroxidase-family protein